MDGDGNFRLLFVPSEIGSWNESLSTISTPIRPLSYSCNHTHRIHRMASIARYNLVQQHVVRSYRAPA